MVLQLNWQNFHKNISTQKINPCAEVVAAAKLRLAMKTALTATLLLILASYAATSAKAAPAGGQTLVVDFPKDFSIGTLTVRGANQGPDKLSPLGPAQGRLIFKKGEYYSLDANHKFLQHPEVLKNLPPDCLSSMRLRFSSLDDAEDGLCDKAMKYVGGLTGLRKLNLDRSEVSDVGLSYAKNLVNLETLTLFSTLLNGAAFKELRGLKKLDTVAVALNELTPDSYQYFATFPKLRVLVLRRCHPNDQAMKSIGKCSNLDTLDLSGNQSINDHNVKYLSTLKKLHLLDLYGSNVTLSGLEALKGLPLIRMTLPEREYSAARLAALKKIFPNTAIAGKTTGKINKNDETIFAPLH